MRISARSTCRATAVRPAVGIRANLVAADLSDANLNGADLRGADLSYVNFTTAYLGSSILTGCHHASTP